MGMGSLSQTNADGGIVLVLGDASQGETRARVAQLESARMSGAEVVIAGRDDLGRWLAQRPRLRRFVVVPSGAELGDDPLPDPPTGHRDFVAYRIPKTDLSTRFYLEGAPLVLSWSCSRGVRSMAGRAGGTRPALRDG